MKVSIYGAGKFAKQYLPKIREKFEIMQIFDMAEEKQGTQIYGIEILKPCEAIVNTYPVMILLNNAESAYRFLKKLGCTQPIYRFLECPDRFGFYLMDTELPFEELDQQGFWFQSKERDFANVKILENAVAYIPGQRRYFDIASSYDFNAPGGPCACLRNLRLANEEYGLIGNLYTLCPSKAYIPQGVACEKIDREQMSTAMQNSKPEFHKQDGAKQDELFWLYSSIQSGIYFLKELDMIFRFREDDVFLLQDMYILEAFLECFPHLKRVTVVSHNQGVMSSELKKRYPSLAETLDAMQKDHLKAVHNWIFPSRGAADGFLETGTDEIRAVAHKCNFHVAYNGYQAKEAVYADEDFLGTLDRIETGRVVFCSAAFLYLNKGVERIPEVLSYYRDLTGKKIFWILVGSGEMEDEVEKSIRTYLQEDEYAWYKKRFENQDNIFSLFMRADYYVMMHRVSVFDLSTLQAMAYGCVPLLSDIGGNKELCGFQNGILVDAGNIQEDMKKYYSENEFDDAVLEDKKNRNMEIVREYFDNKAFLKGYRDVLYSI